MCVFALLENGLRCVMTFLSTAVNLDWASKADLMRLKGMGEKHRDAIIAARQRWGTFTKAFLFNWKEFPLNFWRGKFDSGEVTIDEAIEELFDMSQVTNVGGVTSLFTQLLTAIQGLTETVVAQGERTFQQGEATREAIASLSQSLSQREKTHDAGQPSGHQLRFTEANHAEENLAAAPPAVRPKKRQSEFTLPPPLNFGMDDRRAALPVNQQLLDTTATRQAMGPLRRADFRGDWDALHQEALLSPLARAPRRPPADVPPPGLAVPVLPPYQHRRGQDPLPRPPAPKPWNLVVAAGLLPRPVEAPRKLKPAPVAETAAGIAWPPDSVEKVSACRSPNVPRIGAADEVEPRARRLPGSGVSSPCVEMRKLLPVLLAAPSLSSPSVESCGPAGSVEMHWGAPPGGEPSPPQARQSLPVSSPESPQDPEGPGDSQPPVASIAPPLPAESSHRREPDGPGVPVHPDDPGFPSDSQDPIHSQVPSIPPIAAVIPALSVPLVALSLWSRSSPEAPLPPVWPELPSVPVPVPTVVVRPLPEGLKDPPAPISCDGSESPEPRLVGRQITLSAMRGAPPLGEPSISLPAAGNQTGL